jgi:hypothetical protein
MKVSLRESKKKALGRTGRENLSTMMKENKKKKH